MRKNLGGWVGLGAVVVACSAGTEHQTGQDLGRMDGGGGGQQPPTDGAPDSQSAAVFLRGSVARSPSTADPVVVVNLVEGNNRFAFDLYGQVRTGTGNLFLSPFSITVAMAMAWAGASGTTESEIATVFHFADQTTTHAAVNSLDQALHVESDALALRLADALWLSPTFHPQSSYLDTLAASYGAGVGLVDFTAPGPSANTIDRWVSDQTGGTIPRLLEPSDFPPLTKAVLTNAAYFRGLWETAFDPLETVDDEFTRLDGTKVPVKMMQSTSPLAYTEGAGYQAATLPYQSRDGRTFEMMVVVPTTDFTAFEASFDSKMFAETRAAMSVRDVELGMPRFELHSGFHLKDTLSALGMPIAFSPTEARFPEIDASAKDDAGTFVLHISDVIHRGFVSVNEAGTTAAAATAVVLALDGGVDLSAPPPPILRLDRPFLLFIRNVETSTLVFMGRVVDPTG